MILLKYLLEANKYSRRKLIELIKGGAVSVNAQVELHPAYEVKNDDFILLEGQRIEKSTYRYFLLNKPSGVVSSAADDKHRKTVVDCISEARNCRLYPVGRLDFDTTGAIIITNDGNLANILMHPSNQVQKEYQVKVDGIITKEILKKLERPIDIVDDEATVKNYKFIKYNSATKVSTINITLTEGKNHEVKRIFESLGLRVVKLKRIRYDVLDLENLKVGEYRELKIHEVKQLYRQKR
ncbi:MAG: rRNA pseudouridine synthase [Acholeplasmatales bacterium]|jgi:23S rRNA pseudouridine2605 synthase|nr:rRNA pseudouridine synthase [Acholeplasmatales bacterium]